MKKKSMSKNLMDIVKKEFFYIENVGKIAQLIIKCSRGGHEEYSNHDIIFYVVHY